MFFHEQKQILPQFADPKGLEWIFFLSHGTRIVTKKVKIFVFED